jgi:AhpD family alkylhydroperoxidase
LARRPSDGVARLQSFRAHREHANARILETGTLATQRFFALDSAVYRDGALPARTKELLGLVGSMVLRCDDCVTYHLIRCREVGVPRQEIVEALDVALVVGGSIVIPHLRRATDMLDALEAEAAPAASPAKARPRKTASRPENRTRSPRAR